MIARLVATIGLTVTLAVPGTAAAQSSSIGISLPSGQHLVWARTATLGISGDVQVRYLGDPAAWCAAKGVCGYSGTSIWKPFGPAELTILKIRRGRSVVYEGVTDFSGDSNGVQSEVVHHSGAAGPPTICADASAPSDLAAVTNRGASLALIPDVRVHGRCAGPLDSDLFGVLPRVTTTVSRFLKGQGRLDMSGVRTFRRDGFAGTIDSSLVITLHKPSRDDSTPRPPSSKPQRFRLVSEPVRVVGGSGGIDALIRGSQDATVCSLLDSCGVQGTITARIRPVRSDGEIDVVGPASVPYRAFRVALGLAPGHLDRRLELFGDLYWDERGKLAQSIVQRGSTCTDSAPLDVGTVGLDMAGSWLRATYNPFSDLRTRCPGPELGDLATRLATGSLEPRALQRRPASIHLTGASTFSDDGYEGRISSSVTLTLRHGRITQRIETN